MSTTAVLNLGLNSSKFNRGLSTAGAKLKSFSSMAGGAMSVIAGVGAVAGVAIVGIGASFIKAAADAKETTNKFNTVFSGLQYEAKETAKVLAESYGLSSRESEKLLSDTGDLLTGFGFSQKAALGLSKQVQQMSADLASFQNLSGGTADASDRITKALTGETESLKQLGVIMDSGQQTADSRQRADTRFKIVDCRLQMWDVRLGD